MRARPLSPHLSVYRFMHTMALSILHRITGLYMALGLLLLVAWLMAAAQGEDSYELFVARWSGGLVRLLLMGWLAAFTYHFMNGIRHLFWDAGIAIERVPSRRSAWLVIAATVIALALSGYLLFCPVAGAP
ncbi:MAG TPA: succinate dehydrogenase, cytochrome b556 subunit [Steroidobacteraceae bacterium]